MSKSKKWSMIAAAISTVTAGGAGGFAFTQGYFTAGETEQVANGDEAAEEGAKTDGADPQTTANVAAGPPADVADSTTSPAGDPFKRAGVTSMADSYGAADDPGPAAVVAVDVAEPTDDDGIPAAKVAFDGIEPAESTAPTDLAQPDEMPGAALGQLTPPAAPQAINDNAGLLPVPDAGQAPAAGPYAGNQYSTEQYGTEQYGTEPYGTEQNGQANDPNAAAPAALEAGVGAAAGALAANAASDASVPDVSNAVEPIQDVTDQNMLARDGGNPFRPRYGDSPAESSPPAAAPATPLDIASPDDGNANVDQANAYQPDNYGTGQEPIAVDAPVDQQHSTDSQYTGQQYAQQDVTQQPYNEQPPGEQPVVTAEPAPTSEDDYTYTRPAGDAAQPVAPLAPVTDMNNRGVNAQPAAADTANQYGVVDSSLAGTTGVGVVAEGAGAGQPGPAQLEGMQQTTVSIEKRAPVEAQVGRKAVWEVFVRNTGPVTAQGVEVHDDVPRGATLSRTHPQAQASDGRVVWELGSLEPGEERRLEMEIIPQVEGDMGSVARVVVGTQATARTTVTKPQLQIEAAAPEEVLIGSLARLVIKVSNVGTGVAHAVRLEEHVPELFEHPGGQRLIYEVGDLGPKQVRELDLMLTAAKAGVTDNRLTVHATGDFTAEKTSRVEVVAPKLEVHFSGPKKRYLQREGTFTLTLNNPGTATAHDVQLAAHVPDGLEFVDANNSGYYDPTTRTVHWLLAELPPGQPADVKLSARAVKEGAHPLVIESTTPQGLRAELSQPIEIEGLAAVSFEVRDVQDPVEVGGRTAYEIRVINQGSKAATNVHISAVIPPTMQAIDASGPTRYTVEAGRVIFAPLPRLAPRADTTYTIEVEAIRKGDSRLRVELTSDEVTTPVTRDEPTVVFSDE